MTWKKISDIKVVCKRCNLGMVFESSLNDTNIILVCNKCKDHVNIEMKGDGTHGVGMPPPSKDKKRNDGYDVKVHRGYLDEKEEG